METSYLPEDARRARNAAARKWRAEHPDEVRKYRANYWINRARREAEQNENSTKTGVTE